MQDGSEKELRETGSSNGWEGVIYHFEVPYYEGDSVDASKLINIEDVIVIKINDKLIKMSQKISLRIPHYICE